MKLIEMMMRALTHLNIGATIAIVAWLFFSVVNAAKADTEIRGADIGPLSHLDSTPMLNLTAWPAKQGGASNRPVGWRVQP